MTTRSTAARWLVPPALIVLLSTLPGCAKPDGESAGTAHEIAPVPVQAVTARVTTLHPEVELVGTLVAIPERTATIAAQIARVIDTVKVVEGQAAKAGDVLLTLDDRQAKVDAAKARAVVAEKSAALTRLKRGPRPQEIEIARQDRDKAQAALDGHRAQLAALQPLRDRQEVSDVQWETAQTTVRSAEAAWAAAKKTLELLEIGTREELIAEAESQRDLAQADADTAELALKFCVITTPIDGLVTQLAARQGQFAERFVPLATVVDQSELFAQVHVPAAHFAAVQSETPATVLATSLASNSHLGHVARLSGQADPGTGNVDAFVLVKNPGRLRPGMACTVRLKLPDVPDALVVPTTALADRDGTPVVTLIRDGKAFETKVELGSKTHDLAQILHGLSPGDAVATSGGYGLPEGCPVKIVSDLATAKTGAN